MDPRKYYTLKLIINEIFSISNNYQTTVVTNYMIEGKQRGGAAMHTNYHS